MRKEPKGVVVVSSEEEEVLGICDRVIVMKNGRIAAILNAKNGHNRRNQALCGIDGSKRLYTMV